MITSLEEERLVHFVSRLLVFYYVCVSVTSLSYTVINDCVSSWGVYFVLTADAFTPPWLSD